MTTGPLGRGPRVVGFSRMLVACASLAVLALACAPAASPASTSVPPPASGQAPAAKPTEASKPAAPASPATAASPGAAASPATSASPATAPSPAAASPSPAAAASGGASASANPASFGLVQAGTITAATQDVQRPFTMINAAGQREGFAIDIVDEVAKRLGLKTTYTAMALPAILSSVGTGQYDLGAIGLQVTPERRQTIDFSTPYYWGYAGLIVPKSAAFKSLDEMDGKAVAALRGSVQEATLKDKYPKVVLKTFDGQSAAVAALRGGQVDGFLVGGADAEEYVKQEPSWTITQEIPSDNPTALPIAKGKTAFGAAVDEQIIAMIKDGTYKKLYDKWFSQPMLKPFLDLHPELAR